MRKTADLGPIEAALLSGLMRHNADIAECAAVLDADHFTSDQHRKIYKAIVALHLAGKPADLVQVAGSLHQSGKLADVGGHAYLAELWEAEPTGMGNAHRVTVLRDNLLLRRLSMVAEDIGRMADEPTDSAEATLAKAESMILDLGRRSATASTVDLPVALRSALDAIDSRHTGAGVKGLSTGLDDVDAQTGGLHAGELAIVAARPSFGKTSYAIQLSAHAAVRLQKPVLFCSLEQSYTEIAERMLCQEGRVDSWPLRVGKVGAVERKRLSDAFERLHGGRMRIDDASAQSVLRIGANARRMKHGGGLGLIVVDYLQLVEPENRRDPRHEQVGLISRRLKQLARDLAVPVLVLSQLNRSVEDRADGTPRLSDLRESGEIEQNADLVMLMHRPEQEKDNAPGLIELHVAKQRNGPVGIVTLCFLKKFMRFELTPDVPRDMH
jgi:replicative DNA helicase